MPYFPITKEKLKQNNNNNKKKENRALIDYNNAERNKRIITRALSWMIKFLNIMMGFFEWKMLNGYFQLLCTHFSFFFNLFLSAYYVHTLYPVIMYNFFTCLVEKFRL